MVHFSIVLVLPASVERSIAVGRSERSQTAVDRWKPTTQQDTTRRTAEPASSHKKRKMKCHQRSHHDDGKHSISSDMMSMEDESMDNQAVGDDADDNDKVEVEVATLVIKLREGYDRRQSVALDSLSKESIVCLRQQVLDEAGDHVTSISGQISSLISTSTSLKMVGYYLRATLAMQATPTSWLVFSLMTRDRLTRLSTVSTMAPLGTQALPPLLPNLSTASTASTS